MNTQVVAQALLSRLRNVLGTSREAVFLHEPSFNGNEIEYVTDCIRSGWVSSVGQYVDRFESLLSQKCGGAHAVATVNGTAALHICVLLAGIEAGDEVLLPSLTFVATANAVKYAGATPHFIDCLANGAGLDVQRLDRYLCENTEVREETCINKQTQKHIKALIVMHLFGHISELAALTELARKYKLQLIEDAAEALGSRYQSMSAGSHGNLTAFSFNGNKIVTAGGGGAVVTTDKALAVRAKHLTTTAKVAQRNAFYHDEVGYNYRMPNLNAALVVAQLEQLDSFLAKKRQLAECYKNALADFDHGELLVEPADCISNYWLNTLRLFDVSESERDDVLVVLQKAGFHCRPVWVPLHKLPMYAACPRMDLVETEHLQYQLINMPSSAFLVD